MHAGIRTERVLLRTTNIVVLHKNSINGARERIATLDADAHRFVGVVAYNQQVIVGKALHKRVGHIRVERQAR